MNINVINTLSYPYVIEQNWTKKENIPLYYWDARKTQGFSNFGDTLSEVLIEKIIGHQVRVIENPFCNEKKLYQSFPFEYFMLTPILQD